VRLSFLTDNLLCFVELQVHASCALWANLVIAPACKSAESAIWVSTAPWYVSRHSSFSDVRILIASTRSICLLVPKFDQVLFLSLCLSCRLDKPLVCLVQPVNFRLRIWAAFLSAPHVPQEPMATAQAKPLVCLARLVVFSRLLVGSVNFPTHFN
jgi:hypothetical protein